MRVLTVPRSIASSFLKNFSMNFTATVPPPNWQGPREASSYFRAATRMPERKNDYLRGGCLGSYKESMRAGFQCRMTAVRCAQILYEFNAFRLPSAISAVLCDLCVFRARINAEGRRGPQ